MNPVAHEGDSGGPRDVRLFLAEQIAEDGLGPDRGKDHVGCRRVDRGRARIRPQHAQQHENADGEQ